MIKITNYLKQKGQGIVEYALILAFVVGVALMLNSTTLGNAEKSVFDYVVDYLTYRTYYSYYGDWHKLSNGELKAIDNKIRVKADQEALQALGENLLGLSKEDALEELTKLVPNINSDTLNKDVNGNSQVFAIMDYYDHYDLNDPNKRYITLGHDRQLQAVDYLTGGQATTYKQWAADNTVKNDRTIAVDRFFYSDGMAGQSSQRTITAQLHYDSNNKVDSVNIVAHQGNQNGAVVDGMNVTVTGKGWRGYSAGE